MQRQAILISDIGYGDNGKGSLTDKQTREFGAHTVVRFNGGAQAGHRVVTANGREHVFSQFGSGTFVPGVRTFLSRFLVLKPLDMMSEERRLQQIGVVDALTRTYFDRQALVATPFHAAVNRLLEIDRCDGRHGSCGMGIGQAVFDAVELGDDAVRLGDYRDFGRLESKLCRLQEWKRECAHDLIERCRARSIGREEIGFLEDTNLVRAYIELIRSFAQQFNLVDGDKLAEILQVAGTVVFEGAQAVLLDRWRGFMPYCTPSVCTFDNALELLHEHEYDGEVQRLGVIRAYMVRHGPGPFVTENAELTAALPDARNSMHQWQREFRIGWLDLVALKYAIACCGGVDALAVTCLDRLRNSDPWLCCSTYDFPAAHLPDQDLFFKMIVSGQATNIRLGSEHDLAYQHQLTERLLQAQPCFEQSALSSDFDQRVRQHLEFLTANLGVKVAWASFGPTATDVRAWS